HALAEVRTEEAPRSPTGIGELDRVLGGGLVPGSVVLIGGDPGIGKSTLLLQAAAA
ncbi:MAG: DNA repair protein RadA, partial [Gammaproteobacteria bacterium]|nr:DNA repair protein RadA [Gammaproteobacteria bacterium]NIR99002.1 DNA repair protein RadA [Gammaproteobacteria bacterium]NIT64631.1 DNA repair protein RadA [Gammaproteobacteria bacterium]NIV21604.1 DNA repair protein RadA [Gammaproteobacteria bacterium]NIX11315.1 DNA repair protein RadA [Gammaproteobacteria bacterium]